MVKNLGWIPLLSLLVYIFFFSIGKMLLCNNDKLGILLKTIFHSKWANVLLYTYISGIGPLAWTLNAELFPPEAKTVASPITFCFNWLCAFLVTKYEPDLEGLIGASGAYFLFAGICAAGKLYT